MASKTPYTSSAKYYDFIYLSKSEQMYEDTLRDFMDLCYEILGDLPSRIIDLGCGTGNHAVKLAKMGIQVTGLDYSQDQLDVAIKKAKEVQVDIEFIQGDMAKLPNFNQEFDAGAGFFSSFCYLLSDENVLNFLNKTFEIISDNGFLYFEFWNTLGVIDGSSHLFEAESDGMKLRRYNTSSFDFETSLITMPMHHLITKNNEILDEFVETHILRTYTLSEFKSIVSRTKWKVHSIFNGIMGSTRDQSIKKDSFRYIAVLVK